MTIQIKLDTNALSSLIEKDPEFQLQIQQAVLENIAHRYIKGVGADLTAAVEAAARLAKNEVAKEFGTYSGQYRSSLTLNSDITADIKNAVQSTTRKELEAHVRATLASELEYQKSLIKQVVSHELKTFTNKTIAAEIQAKVAAALSTIKF